MSVPDVTADPSEIKPKAKTGKRKQKKKQQENKAKQNKKSSFPILHRGYRNIAAR